MTVIIENSQLKAEIAEYGAELVSLKAKHSGIEYIWQGNPEFWGRHAPVLFPFVGRLKNDQYMYQGRTYSMGQHGFARDMEFNVIEHGPETASFSLRSTDKTKENYPFDFELVLTYELIDSRLVVHYQVENTGAEEMLFSIGGHPAFNIPLEKDTRFEDYSVVFAPEATRVHLPLKGPYIDMQNKTREKNNARVPLTRELFKNDALVFETKGKNEYTLESEKSAHSVTLSYDNMPYVGIWSPYPKEAPFVCIEPWCGIADTTDSDGHLVRKQGINQLATGQIFQTEYAIKVK